MSKWRAIVIFFFKQKTAYEIILTSAAGSSALALKPNMTIGQIYGHKTITSTSMTDPNGNLYIAKGTEVRYVKINGALVHTGTKQIQYTPEKFVLADPNPKFNASFVTS